MNRLYRAKIVWKDRRNAFSIPLHRSYEIFLDELVYLKGKRSYRRFQLKRLDEKGRMKYYTVFKDREKAKTQANLLFRISFNEVTINITK